MRIEYLYMAIEGKNGGPDFEIDARDLPEVWPPETLPKTLSIDVSELPDKWPPSGTD
jgi:hypothetical protein